MKFNFSNLNKTTILKTILISVSLILTISWLRHAPSGLLGKMDAIGYAVCHRIDLRSFHLGERAIPLCARCSGMHLGALLGFTFQWQLGRKGKLPPLKILIVFGILAVAFAIDGLNSYLHFFPGGAYESTYNRLVNSEFYERLMLESSNTTNVISRYDPNAKNYEMADTSKVNEYTQKMGIDNSIQNLDGMYFQMQSPIGGKKSPQTYVRFSGAIYNRWDFDPETNKYNRFVDTANAINGVPESYVQLIDRANNEPIAVENVVMIYVRHTDIDSRPTVEVLDVSLLGTGKAYAMRDGNLYEVTWSRPTEQSVLTLLNADGTPFAFRPGKTWVEVMSYNTVLEEQDDGAYRFNFISDW